MECTLPCDRRVTGISSHSLCICSSRCMGLMALQELCLPPSGAEDAPGRILTHKRFLTALGMWKYVRGLQAHGGSWIPAVPCNPREDVETPLGGCQVHVFSISLAEKLSQPLPPFHWAAPQTSTLFSVNFFLCAPALLLCLLQAFPKKTNKKIIVKLSAFYCHAFHFHNTN